MNESNYGFLRFLFHICQKIINKVNLKLKKQKKFNKQKVFIFNFHYHNECQKLVYLS